MILPLGYPPTPVARSRLIEPVEITSRLVTGPNRTCVRILYYLFFPELSMTILYLLLIFCRTQVTRYPAFFNRRKVFYCTFYLQISIDEHIDCPEHSQVEIITVPVPEISRGIDRHAALPATEGIAYISLPSIMAGIRFRSGKTGN